MKLVLWTTVLLIPAVTSAVTIGQMDDFEDGTLEEWTVAAGPGGGVPDPSWAPQNALGGPAGADDNYLLMRSLGGGGSGSRLTVMNLTTWTGNYTMAGVTAIQMDVRNFGTTDLTLRLLFETLGAAGPTDVAVTSTGISLAAGSDWTSVLFPIDPGSLTELAGDINTVLANTNVLRIFHNDAPVFPPDPIAAQLGVDNFTATQVVPEPSTIMLAGAGLLAALLLRRR